MERDPIPVYYVSHAFIGAELKYPLIEGFTYTLVLESRKLRPYFEAHKGDRPDGLTFEKCPAKTMPYEGC